MRCNVRIFDTALLVIVGYTLCVLVTSVSSVMLIELLFYKKLGVKIDCITASFNPDIATLSKEACRK
jgi:hypothetical protein